MVAIAVLASMLVAERLRQRQVSYRVQAERASAREQAFRGRQAAAELSEKMAASYRFDAVNARVRDYSVNTSRDAFC